MRNGLGIKLCVAAFALGAALTLLALKLGAAEKAAAQTQTIKGEVVDLMCYLDHGAKGEKHKGCATKCIKGGGPVGLLTADNQLYLVVGDHQPMNEDARGQSRPDRHAQRQSRGAQRHEDDRERRAAIIAASAPSKLIAD